MAETKKSLILYSTLTGNTEKVAQNLYKLVNVLCVEDITESPMVVRDLALIKVKTNGGSSRSEVMQIVDTFRARVVDVSPKALMIEVTGAEDKIDGLAEVLEPYGIIEMVRTGRVAMVRGTNGE